MISFRSLLALSALILSLAFGATPAKADQVDSPLYKAWSTFKVGSTKTLSGTMSIGGIEVKSEITSTLKEVTDDHVTLEVVASHTINGQAHDSPPHTQTYPSKMDANGFKAGDDESIDAMGKTFKCKVITIGSDAVGAAGGSGAGPAAATATVKIWYSDEVPGGTVKMEASSQRPGLPAGTTITLILTACDAK